MSTDLQATADPSVFIEERREGYVRYIAPATGRRWEAHGVCDRRGDCLIGAVVEGEQIRDHAHLAEMCERLGRERIDSELDVPVGPGFTDCCPLRIVEV